MLAGPFNVVRTGTGPRKCPGAAPTIWRARKTLNGSERFPVVRVVRRRFARDRRGQRRRRWRLLAGGGARRDCSLKHDASFGEDADPKPCGHPLVVRALADSTGRAQFRPLFSETPRRPYIAASLPRSQARLGNAPLEALLRALRAVRSKPGRRNLPLHPQRRPHGRPRPLRRGE